VVRTVPNTEVRAALEKVRVNVLCEGRDYLYDLLRAYAAGRTDSFSPATRSTATSVDKRGLPAAERER